MKVSILLITYNHSKYIDEAINSILMQQTTLSKEIIVLDDASNDNTFEIAVSMLAGFQNCKFFKNDKNIGITRNYQRGFSLCEGEYIFVLEGDDYWIDINKLNRQVYFLDAHPYHSMCFHPFIIRQGITSVYKKVSSSHSSAPIDSFSIKDLILNEGLIANFSVCCYRKKLLDSLPADLYNHLAYDWIINIFMGHFGLLGRINETMSCYRYTENATWSNKPVEQQLFKMVELIPFYDELLKYEYTKLFQQKKQVLEYQIKSQNNHFNLRQWVPPLMISLLKLLVPPIILNKKK